MTVCNRAPRRRPSVFCAVCRGCWFAHVTDYCVSRKSSWLWSSVVPTVPIPRLTRTTRPSSTINPLVVGVRGLRAPGVSGSVRATMTGTVEFGHNFLRLRAPVRSYRNANMWGHNSTHIVMPLYMIWHLFACRVDPICNKTLPRSRPQPCGSAPANQQYRPQT